MRKHRTAGPARQDSAGASRRPRTDGRAGGGDLGPHAEAAEADGRGPRAGRADGGDGAGPAGDGGGGADGGDGAGRAGDGGGDGGDRGPRANVTDVGASARPQADGGGRTDRGDGAGRGPGAGGTGGGPTGRVARYLAAATFARLADEGAQVGLVLLAVRRTGSPALGGLLVAALMVPHVVAAPVAGALADTVRRRRLFHGAALALYGTGLIVLAGAVGRVPSALSLAAALATGCCGPLLTGGLTSLLGGISPPERLRRAYSLDATTYNLSGIAGPALAGTLGAAVGPGFAMAVLGASALVGAGVLGTLRLDVPARTAGAGRRPRADDLLAGARELIRIPALRSVTWASSFSQLGTGALPVLAVLLAQRYHASWATGGLMAAEAVGALAGSLFCAWRPWRTARPELVVLWGLPVLALPLAALPAAPGPAVAAALFALAGMCAGPMFSALLFSRERYAPAAVRTQIFTLGAGLKTTAAAGGAAAAGTLAGRGPTSLLLAAALVQFGAAAIGALSLGRRRGHGVVRGAAPGDA